MEDQLPVIKQILPLTETMGESLQHIQELLHDGRFEAAMPLFDDLVQAYSSIERALQPFFEEWEETEDLESQTALMKNSLDAVVSALEKNEYEHVKEIMQFTLLPQWKKWHQLMESRFQRFLHS
ncbi:hypothetical protein [Salibacterium halotolerans]|uniref:DUF8042 domain-containing protein n=1 Tax=Salibacterium halotolerans TaxID=1884432 RepID=A0A1I5VV96_9BACI|nr:hypothetical protein [Salibacterium halotolerans]SFQ11323.1 hypothetical protein SAMN05518683_11765 [Salibacterium halotolerans]